uniref:Uncharacterized protein n=1 Tax=Lactifluus piperatus TaxID=71966 RepID=A0A2Z4M973_9AGAM|nr:hypothetical protein [Lactifluus piperatus]AWX53028.1 hypothetical protein [Lactifluus piperatus]
MEFLSNNEIIDNIPQENKWNWKNIAIYFSIIVAGCFIFIHWDEIRNLFDKSDKPDFDSEGLITTGKNPPVIDIKGKTVDLSSPESSNPVEVIEISTSSIDTSSPTGSTSSIETIKPSLAINTSSGSTSSTENFIGTPSELLAKTKLSDKPLTEKISILTNTFSKDSIYNLLVKHWKSFVDQDIYEGINYIEKNFPKSEWDKTPYFDYLIKDIQKKHINFMHSTSELNVAKKITPDDFLIRNKIAQETENWLREIEKRIDKLD